MPPKRAVTAPRRVRQPSPLARGAQSPSPRSSASPRNSRSNNAVSPVKPSTKTKWPTPEQVLGKAKSQKNGAHATDDMSPLEDVAPVKGPKHGERVHVFLRVRPAEEPVRSTIDCEHGGDVAYPLDLVGKRHAPPAQIDRVLMANEADTVSSISLDVTRPVVERALAGGDPGEGRTAAILVYGEPVAGADEAMYGESNHEVGGVLGAAVEAATHAAQQSGGRAQLSATLLFMEIAWDLLQPGVCPAIREEAGGWRVSFEGSAFEDVASPRRLRDLLHSAMAEADRVVEGVAAPFAAMAHRVFTLRVLHGKAEDPNFKKVHVVQLSPPPPQRLSTVAGLAVEDYCALNTSLKGLESCLSAMAKKKKNKDVERPPFRDALLTRLLAPAMGTKSGRTSLIVCASADREEWFETVAAIEMARLAAKAHIRAEAALVGDGKGLTTKLQAALAAAESPTDETRAELETQLRPDRTSVDTLRSRLHDLSDKADRDADEADALERELAQVHTRLDNLKDDAERDARQLEAEIADLDDQQANVQRGGGVDAAMKALRKAAKAESSQLRLQLDDMKSKLANTEADATSHGGAINEQMRRILPNEARKVIALGNEYVDRGLFQEAVLAYMNATTVMESVLGPEHQDLVEALMPLAFLYGHLNRWEDAAALHKRCYEIHRKTLGPDDPRAGRHLVALGSAHSQLNNAHAAAITLEEARAILAFALGPEHPEVQELVALAEQVNRGMAVDAPLSARGEGTITPRRTQAAATRMHSRLNARERQKADASGADLFDDDIIVNGGRQHDDLTGIPSDSAELLQRKRAVLAERMQARAAADDADSEEEETEAAFDVDAADGGAEDLLEAESRMAEALAHGVSAAVGERWGVVVDAAVVFEELIMRGTYARAAGASAALRVLRNGMRNGSTDEGRARAVLAVLMVMEWCVPAVDPVFRRALAGDQWMRRLVDLARKDASEKRLVAAAVVQLLANWKEWYGRDAECKGFGQACDLLRREGFTLPAAQPQPGNAANDAGPEKVLSAEAVRAELAVMREDSERLRQTIAKADRSELTSIELAEAQQASQDCRGWLRRIDVFLGNGPSAGNTTARGTPQVAPSSMKKSLRKLQDELHRAVQQWEDIAPRERKESRTRTALRQGMTPPAFTPRGSVVPGSDGLTAEELPGGLTPRTAALFASPGLALQPKGPLSARGPAPASGRDGRGRSADRVRRSGANVAHLPLARGHPGLVGYGPARRGGGARDGGDGQAPHAHGQRPV